MDAWSSLPPGVRSMTTSSGPFGMPVRGDEPDLLVDTSVAVALVVADHEHHRATVGAIANRPVGFAGHAAFQTFSVGAPLPPPLRRTPQATEVLLARSFPT